MSLRQAVITMMITACTARHAPITMMKIASCAAQHASITMMIAACTARHGSITMMIASCTARHGLITMMIAQLQLQGFSRLRLAPGEKQTVQFTLTPEQMSLVDADGRWVLEPGEFKVWVGGQQPNLKTAAQPVNVLAGQFTVQA
ncbi:MAG: fibronectin type III-like domain-contianing protein [Anaerolineales bacterium]|nr:fibronectin type III-like domain-contianing protein [Anaerolineales bacterium]